MEAELERLEVLLKKERVAKEDVPGVLMYLAVCFLAIDGENVSKHFKVKYHRVRHWVTFYGVRLKKSQFFMNKMHRVAKAYLESQGVLKLTA